MASYLLLFLAEELTHELALFCVLALGLLFARELSRLWRIRRTLGLEVCKCLCLSGERFLVAAIERCNKRLGESSCSGNLVHERMACRGVLHLLVLRLKRGNALFD